MTPRPPRRRTVDAVILRLWDVGEADRMLSLYSREEGKGRALAKGVRRPRSRRAGHLQPLSRTRLLLAQARSAPIVAQAEAVEVFPALRRDVTRYAYAAQVAELVERFVWEGEHYPGLFTALLDALRGVAREPHPDWPVRFFELRLLDWVGFRPELHHCTVCGAPIRAEDQFFSASHGGVVCPRCGPRTPDAQPVNRRTLKFLRHLQRSTWPEARRVVPDAGVRRALEEVLQAYLTFVLERPLRGAAVQRQLRRHAQGPRAAHDAADPAPEAPPRGPRSHPEDAP